ncbi:MAG TPA: nucleoside hydrolase, partial [Streptosporangiaceae bacterium]|nr:nucleoside hydrolase [Streptosporangiaceae bacterium]
EPRLADWVRGFVIMGGSSGRGNVTPAAEYNIWADPEAAAAVFRAGWTVIMLGLDVTMRTGATEAVLRRMSGLGPLGTGLLLPALEQYRSVSEPGLRGGLPGGSGGMDSPRGVALSSPLEAGPPVHDVCAVAWVAEPDLFGLVPARVQVEMTGQFTAGMTVTDFDFPGEVGSGNALVAMRIDVDKFWDVTLDTYARVADGMRR